MKTQKRICEIVMDTQVLERSYCPRCENAVTTENPHCIQCSLWLPWGDRRVRELRGVRRAEFAAREEREEREWLEARANSQSQAPALGTNCRVARWWHLAALRAHRHRWPLRAVGTVAVLAAMVLVKRDTIRMQEQHTRSISRLERLAGTAKPTGLCADGSETFAQSRVGACSGHGGVSQFYK